jgi:hypothetical protein
MKRLESTTTKSFERAMERKKPKSKGTKIKGVV